MRELTGMNGIYHRSLRLADFDYAEERTYFVTVCACVRGELFGRVVGDTVQFSAAGEVALAEWLKTGQLRPYVLLDAFVIMPDHMHAVLIIDHGDTRWRQSDRPQQNVAAQRAAPIKPTNVEQAQHAAPLQIDVGSRVVPQSLGAIVRGYKSAVTKQVNDVRGTPGAPVWQRNYYDHIIRNEHDLNLIRTYIDTNPARWAEDRESSLNRPVWKRTP